MNWMLHLLTFSLTFNCSGQTLFGLVQVDENLWVDQTEITNAEYFQFVAFMRDRLARELLFMSGMSQFGIKTNNGRDIQINWYAV